MGESVAEATITSWLKDVGDTIEMDEAVVEIATDKVDSEVPCEVDGVLLEKRFNINDVVYKLHIIVDSERVCLYVVSHGEFSIEVFETRQMRK